MIDILDLEKAGLVHKEVILDGIPYLTHVKQVLVADVSVPRLAIVSYLPESTTIPILQLCIKTIKKFTDTPYELWVCDNNSPIENIQWLLDEPDVNVILNRTSVPESGSYANAIGLELAAHFVHPETLYFMTLHQDTAPCRKGWLSYLLSKFDDQTRAVGVREDKSRIKEGILHVLGYIVDFQLFKNLNLSFYPDLPEFDIGDKVIYELQQHGYQYFYAPNTLWDESLIDKIANGEHFKKISVDRSLDENGNVFFLHLGRGVLKSQEKYASQGKSIEVWSSFIEDHLLHDDDSDKHTQVKLNQIEEKVEKNLWYSLRRYYVDKFFVENINVFEKGSSILDIGGKKFNKRGEFDIEEYNLSVKYANLDESTEPDFLCDATAIPTSDNTFDGVVLAEVLEHVPFPKEALKEAYRVLKPNRKVLITTPFMLYLHPDPSDYCRYTDQWYQEVLEDIGFHNIIIHKHGLFPSVVASLLKSWAYELVKTKQSRSGLKNKIFSTFALWFTKKAFAMEQQKFYRENKKLAGHTTGFGIIASKQI